MSMNLITKSLMILGRDDVFSIGIGLARVGFARSVRLLRTLDSFAKIRNKKYRRGLVRCLSHA